MTAASCSVFVANIPFGATEEQLADFFSMVGPVKSFRLVFDKTSGRSKGYGFCEYHDASTATSAMRNMHGREFQGRALKVDFSLYALANLIPVGVKHVHLGHFDIGAQLARNVHVKSHTDGNHQTLEN